MHFEEEDWYEEENLRDDGQEEEAENYPNRGIVDKQLQTYANSIRDVHYWNFTHDQINEIVQRRHDISNSEELSLVILNTFTIEPKIDFPNDELCKIVWGDKPIIFGLAKIIQNKEKTYESRFFLII